MGKMLILTCELCNVVDSAENRVTTVSVAGHKVELCSKERINLLRMVNVSEEHAVAYVREFDKRIGTKGANPSMSQVLEMLAMHNSPAPEAAAPAPESPGESLVSEPVAEETVEKATRRKSA